MDEITTVETIPISIPFTHADGRRGVSATGGSWTTLDLLLVRLEVRSGLTGWGECFGYTLRDLPRSAIETRLASLVVGREVDDVLAHREDVARSVHAYGRAGAVQFALSGLDIALWDLRGKQQERPIHELLGGTAPRFPAYASLFRYGDARVCAQAAERACREGFRTVKLHETTVEAIAATRNACGDEVEIATDVNCIWSRDEAITRIQELEHLRLAWVEEPVWPPDDHEQLASVRREISTPLAAGENEANATTLRRLAASGGIDILQPSVTKLGGITEFVRFLETAELDGMRVIPHSFYIGPGLLATLHAATLAPVEPLIEWMFADPEVSLFGSTFGPRHGMIEVPDGPGLGCDPDADVVAAYRSG